MKKLLFQKFLKDTLKFFILVCLSTGVIVWVIQAVNFLDFMTEDGHGLYVYFSYTLLNFPKIIHRILPFVFFISLFYQISQYELKNELIIFWANGINKLQFINVVVMYSTLFLLFQIFLGSYISPISQNEARSYIRNSNIDFFPSLIKEGRFIDTVEKLTIFIESKDSSGNYNNLFLEELINKNESNETKESKSIFAKSGRLNSDGKIRYLELFDGQIIDRSNGKVNNFSFKKINFDLTKYGSKSTTYPKIQELSINVLIECLYYQYTNRENEFYNKFLNCKTENLKAITQEVSKRIYKPIYIPLLALLTCLIILKSKEDINYSFFKTLLFLLLIIVIIISEVSLRYLSAKSSSVYFFVLFPIITFLITYVLLIRKLYDRSKI